ncbi:alanine racemase [Alicyclobacillus sp. TC]|uniref:alanine racemase n=1 Tax=Alicyclobacillus sp. TC TaxID=2606450 RepID=UPI0019342F1C|nr:alanine racemase [Alicyclobacillus sp. TC]
MFRGTFAVIDLSALVNNVKKIQSVLPQGTKILVAVKANAYGHGDIAVAKAIEKSGSAHMLGLASLEEALRLREAGVRIPLLVLGYVDPLSFPVASQHQIELTFTGSSEDLLQVSQLSTPLQLHLKMDTGMGRLGLRSVSDVLKVAESIHQRPDLHLQGLFTHLAKADSPEDGHTSAQLRRFEEACSALAARGLLPPLLHAANTAAALQRQDAFYHMVRIGIGAYGYAPNADWPPSLSLQRVMHLYSTITRIAWLKAGDSVSYGATFVAKQDCRVATVCIGYADGYPRSLSNRGFAMVRGRKAPLLGRVCMDQLMLDVTHIPEAELGDPVTLFGHLAPDIWNGGALFKQRPEERERWIGETFSAASNRAEMPLDTLSRLAGTISYEMLTSISNRVPRIEISF